MSKKGLVKIVTEDKLQKYLKDGWVYKATLTSGKIVVERASN